jgi:hypothetical protein
MKSTKNNVQPPPLPRYRLRVVVVIAIGAITFLGIVLFLFSNQQTIMSLLSKSGSHPTESETSSNPSDESTNTPQETKQSTPQAPKSAPVESKTNITAPASPISTAHSDLTPPSSNTEPTLDAENTTTQRKAVGNNDDLKRHVADAEFKVATGLLPVNTNVDFFGLKSSGRHVAFVIDCSGSMANGRLAAAKRELLKSIKMLSPTQKFSVYFFHEGVVSNPNHANQSPTPKNTQQLETWLSTIQVLGGTNPLPALEIVLAQDTVDVAFLLSDGDFLPRTVGYITSRNKNKVTINTIAFGFDSNNEYMKKIASDNRGSYKFIKN